MATHEAPSTICAPGPAGESALLPSDHPRVSAMATRALEAVVDLVEALDAAEIHAPAAALRRRLRSLAAALQALETRIAVPRAPARSEMDKAVLRSAAMRQTSACAALAGAVAVACGDAVDLTHRLRPSHSLSAVQLHTTRLIAGSAARSVVYLLEEFDSGLDRYSRHDAQRHLLSLRQKLDAMPDLIN